MNPKAPGREAPLLTVPEQPEVTARFWLAEAVRRAAEIDRGIAKRVPAEKVRRQAQALLK
ncbi:MAG TPA: hypothetical protein VGM81_21110 [Burkholderiaceae bacterium]